MCAIYGLIDYKGSLKSSQRLRIVKALGTAAEVRGTDAAGIAFFQRGKLCIQKAAKPAHKIKFRIPSEVRVVIGHTRMTTQGSAKKNQNNHPFPGKAGRITFALAHNGVLHNDYELRYNCNLPLTSIETDSYIAVQLIEQQQELTFDSLREMAEAVEGSFVFTVLSQDNSLYFIKGDNPLTIYHYPKQGVYLYASTEGILSSALQTLGTAQLKPEIIQPEDGMILRIDRHGEQSYSQFTTVNTWPIWMPPFWEPAYILGQKPSATDYIRDLKSVAGYYGYTPDDIDRLLSDGYMPEEIEDMIYY